MTDKSPELDVHIPIKLKLYLTKEERQAYRIAANLTKQTSIANYMAHAISTYTAFLLKELQTQMQATQGQVSQAIENQTASSEEVVPTVESSHDAQVNS